MSYQFWVRRAIKVYAVLFFILLVIQLLKQHTIEESIIFAATWSLLSTTVFIVSRFFQSRRGIECALCNDTPDSTKKSD